MEDWEITQALKRKRDERLTSDSSRWPRRNPVASDTHPCDRYHVFSILGWEHREPFNAYVLGQMEFGNLMETPVIQQLQNEGWVCIRTQENLDISDDSGRKVIGGRMDLVLVDPDDDKWCTDVKAVQKFVFDKLHTEDDLKRDKWAKKWYGQLQLYMRASGIHRGLIYMASMGMRKAIVITYDAEFADYLVRQAVLAMNRIDQFSGTPIEKLDEALNADGIEYHRNQEVCVDCPFYQNTLCAPPIKRGGSDEAVIRDDLEDEVLRHQELSEGALEYARIDRRLKKESRGKHLYAGGYLITGDWGTRQVSAKPATEASEQQVWKMKLLKLRGD